ncbi:hypothetical protein LARI1_G004116 [Lachnellula arida]|uniref:DUF6590 domain-containing protein n=1 Tax=Lachnellula arida TaxID=1316785 RepID=A0A8T9BGN7_9HELO|nr:hypothetical protein LARI1_G004116 [Lachnellula arida]
MATSFGEKAWSKIRYFVVAREMQGCCLCLTLNTYTFQGTSKERLRIEDYAAVYPAGSYPSIGDGENLVKDPFPIIIEDPQERLSPMSRLNFGRVYTVEHNIKVMKVGRITQEFLPRLKSYFVETINGDPTTDVTSKDNAADASSSSVTTGFKEASDVSLTDTSRGGGAFGFYDGSHSRTPDYSGSDMFKNSSTSISLSNGGITPRGIHRVIRGTRGQKEKIDSKFKIHNSKYFKPGEVLWHEPRGGDSSSITSNEPFPTGAPGSKYGEQSFAKIRRFVIVANDHGHSQCVPILTYQGMGKGPQGFKFDYHAIIYSGATPPEEFQDEFLRNGPIQAIPKTARDKLDPASRVNYAKIYTVEHNVKVQFIGRIAEASRESFTQAFDATWAGKRLMSGESDKTNDAVPP